MHTNIINENTTCYWELTIIIHIYKIYKIIQYQTIIPKLNTCLKYKITYEMGETADLEVEHCTKAMVAAKICACRFDVFFK